MADQQKIPEEGNQAITPRKVRSKKDDPGESPELLPDRNFFALHGRVNVEFYERRESHSERVSSRFSQKKGAFSKRADSLTIRLLICALVVLIVVFTIVLVNNKKYFLQQGESHKRQAGDLYPVNSVYSRKADEEQAAKGAHRGGVSRGEGIADQMDVSVEDQMETMNRKIEEMHSKKLTDETPRTNPITSAITGIPPQMKPTMTENMKAPLDLNGMITKP